MIVFLNGDIFVYLEHQNAPLRLFAALEGFWFGNLLVPLRGLQKHFSTKNTHSSTPCVAIMDVISLRNGHLKITPVSLSGTACWLNASLLVYVAYKKCRDSNFFLLLSKYSSFSVASQVKQSLWICLCITVTSLKLNSGHHRARISQTWLLWHLA